MGQRDTVSSTQTAVPGCASQALHPAENLWEAEGQIGVAGIRQHPEQGEMAGCVAADSRCVAEAAVSSAEPSAQTSLSSQGAEGTQGVGGRPDGALGRRGQVLGKLSQATNGTGPHASGSQESQDGLTDSHRGLEGVRTGVEVGQPSHKRLVNVKDQRLGLG